MATASIPENTSSESSGSNRIYISNDSKLNKRMLIIFAIVVAITLALLGTYFYFNHKYLSGAGNGQTPPSGWKTYVDPSGDYKFSYPQNWQLINEVPDEFMYVEMFNNLPGQEGVDWFNSEEGLNTWLSGKMFIAKTCRGPILQNNNDNRLLIAFDINKDNSGDPACFSAGWFFDRVKWKVADEFSYPVGQDSTQSRVAEWRGDYREVDRINKGKSLNAIAALVNRETYNLLGDSEFIQILSTFTLGK